MLLILLHLSLRRARLDKTVKTPETTNKKHGILEEVPLTSWARLLGGLLLRPIPCRLCEKKKLAWSGTFPILWLSCFHVQLVPCGSDISTWDHRVPGLNRTCIGIVSEYLTMYLAYCYCVPGTSHACTLHTAPMHLARMYLACHTQTTCVP